MIASPRSEEQLVDTVSETATRLRIGASILAIEHAGGVSHSRGPAASVRSCDRHGYPRRRMNVTSSRNISSITLAAGVTSTERLTLTVDEVAVALGISRSSAYECARRGDFPTVRLGRRIVVPRRAVLALLGEIDLADVTE